MAARQPCAKGKAPLGTNPRAVQIYTLPNRTTLSPRVDCAAVIDILRATSTIAAALAGGAQEILPAVSLAEARRLAAQNPGVLLAGERRGHKPADFDLGNSPLEFTSTRVAGRTIVTTTTNGTRALRGATRWAQQVVTLSLTNRHAVAEWLAHKEFASLALVCSGDDGVFCGEDLLGAGALLAALGPGHQLDDLSRVALAWFTSQIVPLQDVLAGTCHGLTLMNLGFAQDVRACAALDSLDVVPLYEQANRIVKA